MKLLPSIFAMILLLANAEFVRAQTIEPPKLEELAPWLRVPAATPPVFLAHGGEDISSPPEHSVVMYLALKRAAVPAELHIYAKTAHDFGVRGGSRPYSTWTTSCADWMRDNGFLEIEGNE